MTGFKKSSSLVGQSNGVLHLPHKLDNTNELFLEIAPLQIVFTDQPSRIIIGSDVHLTCAVRGGNDPHTTWIPVSLFIRRYEMLKLKFQLCKALV